MPRIHRDMDSEKIQSLLEQKRREQIKFWEDEMKYFGREKRPQLMDGEP